MLGHVCQCLTMFTLWQWGESWGDLKREPQPLAARPKNQNRETCLKRWAMLPFHPPLPLLSPPQGKQASSTCICCILIGQRLSLFAAAESKRFRGPRRKLRERAKRATETGFPRQAGKAPCISCSRVLFWQTKQTNGRSCCSAFFVVRHSRIRIRNVIVCLASLRKAKKF